MNNLPKYWIVNNDGSKLFQDTVIQYLSTRYEANWAGTFESFYYWVDGNDDFNSTNFFCNKNEFENNPTVLTISQFIELTK